MSLSKASPVRVVILGGGYVTVHAYRSLTKRLDSQLARREVRLTIVAPNSAHDFHGWSGELLGGIIAPTTRLSPLRELFPRARMIKGDAVRIDLDGQSVAVKIVGLDRVEHVAYDHLIVGTGSRDHLESVPGLAAHGIAVKGSGEVLAARNHIVRVLEQADSVTDHCLRERLMTVVIAGGGFAGVEMCAAIAEFFRSVKRSYPVLRKHAVNMVLVHSGDEILPSLRPDFDELADYAAEQLTGYGVHVKLDRRMTCVTEEGAVLSDGTMIPAATVISTLGQARSRLPGAESLPYAPDGRLLTDAELRVQAQPNVWAGGDAACMIHPKTKLPCPANALWAIKHGGHIGSNVARSLLGQPLAPFVYPGLGQAASFGVGKGATELYGMQFTGWIGWTMRLALFHYFMPSRRQAVRAALDWLTLPVLGRHSSAIELPRTGLAAGAARGVMRDQDRVDGGDARDFDVAAIGFASAPGGSAE